MNIVQSGFFDRGDSIILAKSKNTIYVGLTKSGTWKNVPTYISVCPFCDFEKKWRTTGLLPDFLTCENCNQKFRE